MAIAFDNAKYDEASSTTTLTTSFTTGSGLKRIMFIGVAYSGSNSVSSLKYNDVSATLITSVNQDNIFRGLYVLLAPASGTHDLVLTLGSSASPSVFIATYSGVLQTTMNDQDTGSGNPLSDLTVNQTTTLDNCWQLSFGYMGGAGTKTYPTGLSEIPTAAKADFRHSNGALTPAGAFNRTWSTTSADAIEQVLVAFAPYIPSTTTITETVNMTEAKSVTRKLMKTISETVNLTENITSLKDIWKKVVKSTCTWTNQDKSD